MNKFILNITNKLSSTILIALLVLSPLSIINTASAATSAVPNITTQPVAALTTVVNTEFSLSVVGATTSASSTLSYQWKSCDNTGTSCTDITGNNTATSSIYKKTPTATGTEYFKVDVYQTEEGNEISLATTSTLSVVTITSSPTVTLSGPASVNVGETFNVPIVFSNFTTLSGGQFRIVFDNTKVQLLSNAAGKITSSIGANTTFYDSNHDSGDNAITFASTFIKDNSPANNTVSATATEVSILTGTFSDSAGQNFTNQDNSSSVVNGTFITLKFKAIASGDANIRFEDGAVAAGAIFTNTVGAPSGDIEIFNLVNATTIVAANVSSVPSINTQPTSTLSAVTDAPFSLSVIGATTSVGAILSYQWQSCTDNTGTSCTNITDNNTATSSTFTRTATSTGTEYFKVKVYQTESGNFSISPATTSNVSTVTISTPTLTTITGYEYASTSVVYGVIPSLTIGLISGSTASPVFSSLTSTICTVNSTTGQLTKLNVGTCTIKLNVSATSTFAAASSTLPSITTTPKLVTISGGSIANKTFDGSTTAQTVTFGSITGLVNNEVLNFSSTPTFSTSSPGTSIPVDGNYVLLDGIRNLEANTIPVYIKECGGWQVKHYPTYPFEPVRVNNWQAIKGGLSLGNRTSALDLITSVNLPENGGFNVPYCVVSYFNDIASANSTSSQGLASNYTLSAQPTLSANILARVSATGVSVSTTTLSLAVGSSSTITATVAPVGVTINTVKWSSSNPAVATVGTTTGVVRAIATGTVDIVATTDDDGRFTATTTVTVIKPVLGISLSPTSITIGTGNTATITPTITPNDATNQSITWDTSSTTIATVNNGVVTASASATGTVTITATVDGKSATATVTVSGSSASPSISTQPASTTIVNSVTSSSTFSVLATSATGILSYQWQSSTSTDTNSFTNIQGATSTSYTTPIQTERGVWYFRVIVTNTESGRPESSIISDIASLTVTLDMNGATSTVQFINTTATIIPSRQVTFVTGNSTTTIDTSVTTSPGSNNGTYTLTQDRLKTVYMIDNFGNRSSVDIINIKDITDATSSLDKLNKYNEFTVKATADSDSKTKVEIINSTNGNVIASKNDLSVDAISGKVVATFPSNELSGLTSDTDYIIKITSTSASSTDTKYYSRSNVIATSSIRSSIFVSGITLSTSSISLEVGATTSISATVSPNNANNPNLTWTTSSSTIASVSNGVVTAVSAGTATITATTVDGSFTATTLVTVTEALVRVTSVSVSTSSITLLVGATSTIIPTVSPSSSTNKEIAWSSSNSLVASVGTTTGVVTAIATGTVDIIVTTADGGFTATTTVTVTEAPVMVTSVSVSTSSITLLVGATSTIIPTVSPSSSTNKEIAWSSSNSLVASVGTTTGVVTAVGPGTATITATTVDGSFTATTLVTIIMPVSGVSVSPTSITIGLGNTTTITPTFTPNNASNKGLTWSSSDTSIATVNNGVVTASVSATGTVNIIATTVDGSYTATTTIKVVKYINITNVSGLQAISNNLTGDYVLLNDIDLSSISNFTPIGSYDSPFYGSFDGNGHTISHLTISSGTSSALFAYTSTSSVIRNFIISNSNIIGGQYTAAAVGTNFGIVDNVGVVNTIIDGEDWTGGVIGNSIGTSTNLYISGGKVSGRGAGGIIGWLSGYLSNTFSRTNIENKVGYNNGNNASGGIVGIMNRDSAVNTPSINNSYSLSSLYGTGNSFIGGIVGKLWNANIITNSYSDSNMFGYFGVGGVGAITSRVSGAQGGNQAPTTTNVFYNNVFPGYKVVGDGLSTDNNPPNSAVPQSTLYSSTTLPLGNQFQLTTSGNNNYPAVLNSITGQKLGGVNQLVSVTYPSISIPVSESIVNYSLGATSSKFNVTVNSLLPTTYIWQQGTGNNNLLYNNISTDINYTPDTSSAGTLYYRLLAINAIGTTTSSAITVNISLNPSNQPNITAQPRDVTIATNSSATFSVTATAAGTLSYLWALSTNGTDFYFIEDNATSSSYTTSIQSATGTKYYRVRVTNTESGKSPTSINSLPVTLTILTELPLAPTNTGGVISGGGLGYTSNTNSKNNTVKTTPVIQIGGAPNNTTNSPNNTYTPERPFVSDIKPNVTSIEVKELQKFLNNKGYTIASKGAGSPGKETTYLGPATVSAIKKYQKANGLRQTGLLDTATRNVINKLINNTPKSTPVNNSNNNISTSTISISAPVATSTATSTKILTPISAPISTSTIKDIITSSSTSIQNIIENKSEIVVQPIINNSNKRNVNKVAPVVIVNI